MRLMHREKFDNFGGEDLEKLRSRLVWAET